MSNERIDLTKFEGMEEWQVEKRPDGGYAIKTGRDNFSLEEAETIAKLPTLIAELKRCYEEIDTFHPLHGLEVWDEDPDYSRAEWREGVAEGHVTSGYWRWVSNHYLASE